MDNVSSRVKLMGNYKPPSRRPSPARWRNAGEALPLTVRHGRS